MLEAHIPRCVEQYVDDRPLRWREQHLLDEQLALVPAAVTPDELHAGAAKREVEDTRVRCVDEVEAHDLSQRRLARECSLALYEHDVADGHFREASPETVCHPTPLLVGTFGIRLGEGGADGGPDHLLYAALGTSERALRMKCTLQRCHDPPTKTASMAPLRPR
jgi:hypothetical protein